MKSMKMGSYPQALLRLLKHCVIGGGSRSRAKTTVLYAVSNLARADVNCFADLIEVGLQRVAHWRRCLAMSGVSNRAKALVVCPPCATTVMT
jgi:hypothetical protein